MISTCVAAIEQCVFCALPDCGGALFILKFLEIGRWFAVRMGLPTGGTPKAPAVQNNTRAAQARHRRRQKSVMTTDELSCTLLANKVLSGSVKVMLWDENYAPLCEERVLQLINNRFLPQKNHR